MVKSFLGAVFVRTQEVFLAEDLRESSFGAEEVRRHAWREATYMDVVNMSTTLCTPCVHRW
eukprot:34432-Eustigmatos_ZCMA.PRE.1